MESNLGLDLCARAEFPEESPREGIGESTASKPSIWRCQHRGITTNGSGIECGQPEPEQEQAVCAVLHRLGLEKASSPLEDARYWALSYLYN